MAFPTSGAPAATNVTSAATTHTVNIGSPSQGQLLLALGRVPAAASLPASDFPSGWSVLKDVGQAGNSSDRIVVAYKYLAAGAAEIGQATMSVNVDPTARVGAWLVWKISGAEDPATQAPQISADATGASANPNPGSVTPAGGTAKDYLVFALGTAEGEQTTPWGTLPTDYSLYSGGANSGTAGAVATNATVTGAARELNTGAAIDPGAFTMSASDDWIAWTVLVHPGPPAASGTSSVRGGGSVSSAGAKAAAGTSSARSGPRAAAAASSQRFGTSSVRGGGAVTSAGTAEEGGLQTPAFDADLGSTTNAGSHTLEDDAAAGSRVFAAVWCYDPSDITSASDNEHGLTWVRDELVLGTGNDHQLALFSAHAPDGLSLGTVFTPALAAGTPDFGFGITMWSATNVAGGASGYLEDTSEAENADEDWATPDLVTVGEKAFVVGVSMAAEVNLSHTPDTDYAETGPEFTAEGTQRMVAVYRVVTAAGTWNPGGIWTGSSVESLEIGAAYKAASGAAGGPEGTSSVRGGGGATSAGAKHASGTSSVRGGGRATSAVSKGAAGTSSARGGGAATSATRKGGATTSSARGGGAATSTGRKGGLALSAVRGGGSATSSATSARTSTSHVRGGGAATSTGQAGESLHRTGTSSVRGGGSATTVAVSARSSSSSARGGGLVAGTGRKAATASSAVRGGGSATSSTRKAASSTSTVRGGGHVTSTGTALEAHTGTSSVRGGGRATGTGTKGALAASHVRGGGRTLAAALKQAAAASAVRGGGTLTSSHTGAHAGTSHVRGGGYVTTAGGAPELPDVLPREGPPVAPRTGAAVLPRTLAGVPPRTG